jgi:aldehyde dehydrogenase (NAD+)
MSVTDAVVAAPADAALELRIDEIVAAQRASFPRIALTGVAERREKLQRLEKALLAARQRVRDAVWSDFRKAPEEADISEIYTVVSEARFVSGQLRGWMKPRRVKTPITLPTSRAWIRHEPKGVVLIISPWNYPVMLALGPLVSAIAAGNCAVIKPSEHTPATSTVVREIVEAAFPPDEVVVVEGAVETSAALLRRKWDHIFFTGSTTVGRVVMEAAAKHLTPVTLELGGKSPVIIDRTADLDLAARRVAFARCLNGGQTCVAADYVMIEESVERAFVERLVEAMAELFPDPPEPARPMPSIVSVRHFERIVGLVEDAVARGAEAMTTGMPDRSTLRIPPTVLRNVDRESKILDEEIFGPVLPILTWKTRDEAIDYVNARDTPLALYVMTGDSAWRDEVLAKTRAGTSAVNDTVTQFIHHGLPFGGVGASGIGKAHGRAGFEAFSNARAVIQQGRWNAADFLYPPYTPLKRRIAELLIRWF